MSLNNKKPQIPNKPNSSNFIFIIVATLIFFVVFMLMSENSTKVKEIPYSDFISYVNGVYFVSKDLGMIKAKLIEETEKEKVFQALDTHKEILRFSKNQTQYFFPSILVSKVVFKGKKLEGTYFEYQSTGQNKQEEVHFITYMPLPDPFLLKKLEDAGIRVESQSEDSSGGFLGILYSALPYVLLFALIWFLFFRQVQGSNNKAFNFVKSKAKLYKGHTKKVTFDDVAGVDEAKEELKEVVDFLKEPEKFLKMGARIPKGVLLVGPPGTGKTLLAKAVAGEANRPFYSISGSEFVEMFVGVGASRVRDLFDTAKKDAPCIVFIDELDAVGRQRGAGLGGGNDEREQTLNQILVEMDGFDNKETIIVIAATNRPDILDPALLRPGRFDREVVVDRPDLKGREQILHIHTKGKPLAPDVSLEKIARGTPGFSGADLENLVNEAVLIAARKDKTIVDTPEFEEARDKKLMGPERKSRVMEAEELENTAYHEAGHALITHFMPYADPLHKVTIIPRGRALGVTQPLPEKDRYAYTKKYILTQITIYMGGRIGEEYRFGKDHITTGASHDIKMATELAHNLVCVFGMSDKMGPVAYGKDDSPIFIGKQLGRYKDYSEDTAREIDKEVKKIIEDRFAVAQKMVLDNKNLLEELAKELLDKETLHSEDIIRILGPKPAKKA